jgi:hypothetical protein
MAQVPRDRRRLFVFADPAKKKNRPKPVSPDT